MNGMDRRTGKPLGGADHIRQSIEDILGTPLGTRLGRRDYGSELPELFDQPMNELGRIRVFAATALAIMRQEKRARISSIALAAGDAPGSFVLAAHRTPPSVLGIVPAQGSQLGKISEAVDMFFELEIKPLQSAFLEINDRLGFEAVRFTPRAVTPVK